MKQSPHLSQALVEPAHSASAEIQLFPGDGGRKQAPGRMWERIRGKFRAAFHRTDMAGLRRY